MRVEKGGDLERATTILSAGGHPRRALSGFQPSQGRGTGLQRARTR